MTGDAAFANFAREVGRPEGLDLGRAALAIGLMGDPCLDTELWLEQLDVLADAASAAVEREHDPADRARALAEFLRHDYGLSGNRDAYYDPRNSYLHEVLGRRKGIPITLSVVLIEVGRRLEVALEGVGFPAHFLVKVRDAEHTYLDPFNDARVLDLDDCRAFLDSLTGGQLAFRPDMLDPVDARQILARMLRNLKGAFVRRREVGRAIGAIDRLLLVIDEPATEFRDRGLLYVSAEQPERAAADLRYYLAYAPSHATDRVAVRDSLHELERQLWLQN